MTDSSTKRLRDALVKIRNTKALHDQELDALLGVLLGELQDLSGELVACKKQLHEQHTFINHFHQDYQTWVAQMQTIQSEMSSLKDQHSQPQLIPVPEAMPETVPMLASPARPEQPVLNPWIESLPHIEIAGQKQLKELEPQQKLAPQIIPIAEPTQRKPMGFTEYALTQSLQKIGLDNTVVQFDLVPLAVPRGKPQNWGMVLEDSNATVTIEETKRTTPDYYGYQSKRTWFLIPNLHVVFPPLMVQQLGLSTLYTLQPNKPTSPIKIQKIKAPAQMSRSGDSWQLLQQGYLVFEAK